MLSRLGTILSNPASNPRAVAIVIGIVVAALLFVVFVLIAIALPGPERSEEEEAQRRSRARRQRAGCAAAIVAVAVGALASWALWYGATSSDQYCTHTCHSMADASKTWVASAHARVACVACHEDSGPTAIAQNTAFRISCLASELAHTKTLRTSVPDSRCLKCHGTMLDKTMQARNGEPFTHRAAIAGGASCAGCHGKQGHVPARSGS